MINKSLFLTPLIIAPNLSAIPVTTTTTSNIQQPITLQDDIQEEKESCTVMYVGKNVSTTGKAYCCRCGDAGPRGLNMNATIFKHNQLANVEVKGKDGFSWKMPSTTYRYISTPRNPLVRNGLHWEVSTINEMGVGSSATLSCGTNAKALAADPQVPTGISEDNLAQIMGATATSAKEAMQTIAKIIDEKGSRDSNTIMAIDKDEAWLMEIYTGHQYAAIKLPDDKACTIGNEFFLNTLKDYDDVITSKDLFTLPVKNGFAVYEEGAEHTPENMHMYNTYAGEEAGPGTFIDGCHMRTWAGMKLFCKEPPIYDPNKKYEPFFVPDRMPNNKLSVHDIITFYRDRFESILENPNDPDYPYFSTVESPRYVGVDFTYQIHILSVNPDLPRQIAAEETIAFANANYTPFIPLNAGVTSMDEYYTHVSQTFGYDDKSAYCIFKRLNGLADTSRKMYGLPIQNYMANHEDVWQTHYEDLLRQIKDKKLDLQRNVLTNYCTSMQEAALAMSEELFNDLTWHVINEVHKEDPTLFQPFASLEYYAYLYGWEYSKDGDLVTLKNGSDTVTVSYTYTEKPAKGWVEGEISKNGSTPEKVRVTVKQDVACINYDMANKYLAAGHNLVPIKWEDYSTYKDNYGLILGLSIGICVAAAIGFAVPIILPYTKRKKVTL